MSALRIRPRASIVDADLARATTVDLPLARVIHRPHTARGLVRTITSLRRPAVPERMVVVTLPPMTALSRKRA